MHVKPATSKGCRSRHESGLKKSIVQIGDFLISAAELPGADGGVEETIWDDVNGDSASEVILFSLVNP